jgi:hypothetical protein
MLRALPHILTLVLAFGPVAASCSGDLADAGDDGQACYPNQTCNAGLTCEAGTCVGASGPDAAAPDTAQTPDTWGATDSLSTDGGTAAPGQFGAPCDDDVDCFSGICIGHMGDTVCSKTCESDCPAGWSCEAIQQGGSDPIYICVSSFEHLCKPCLGSDECTSSASQAACVGYGDEGDFCGAACEVDSDCPQGFACEASVSTRGGQSSQ